MKRGLFLSGYGCNSWIWEDVEKCIEGNEYNLEFIQWPRELIASFHNVSDFAKWVIDNYIESEKSYDFIVGHSMGGLVALHIANMSAVKINKIVLVESFILSPSAFFQNLLMENTSNKLANKVIDMLKEESELYSNHLKNQLRVLDMTELVNKLNCEISAVYGDRGSNDFNKVLSALQWSEELKSKIKLNVIHNACHFPMLENCGEMVNILEGETKYEKLRY